MPRDHRPATVHSARQPSLPLQVFAIGPSDGPCFESAIVWLRANAAVACFASAEQAIEALNHRPDQPIGAFIFFALRDGQIQSNDVEALHRREPFARLAMLLGTWCEGDVRSGRVIAGVPRIYWHQWPGLLPHAIGLPVAAAPLPRTASDVETLESLLRRDPRSAPILVGVRVAGAATYAMLAEAIAAGGHRSVWAPPHSAPLLEAPVVFLYDAWPNAEDESSPGAARRVLLIDFPRWEDQLRATADRITLVSKPFQLPQLWAALERSIGRSGDMRGGCDDSLSPADWQNSLSQSAGSTKSQPSSRMLDD